MLEYHLPMPSKHLLIVLFLVAGFITSAASAESQKRSLHVDLGTYLTHLTQRLGAPAGFEDKVSSVSGYVRLRGVLPVGKKWKWEPAIGTLFPWKSGVDGNEKKVTTHLDLTFSYPLTQWLRFRIGPGVQWLFSFSDGGAVDLNNGTSTSTFYTPAYSSHSFVTTAQSGLSFSLSSRASLNIEVYGSGLLDRLRRNFDVAATLGWRL
jgi:hypothetical protein